MRDSIRLKIIINGITGVGNTRFIDHDSGDELKNDLSVVWSHKHDEFAGLV